MVNYPRGRTRVGPSAPRPLDYPPQDPMHRSERTYEQTEGAGGEELVLQSPLDAKQVRRRQQIEAREQTLYFARINALLDPQALAKGFFHARPEYPGADLIYHIPNENVAGRIVGGKLKAMGVRRGFPDINVDVPRRFRGILYIGLRLEMKQPQGVLSDVSDQQADWHQRLREQGYRVEVVFGAHEALRLTWEYLGWPGPGPL